MFKHIDMSAAMQRLAERKIEQGMQEGKFDHLEGAGKPLDLEPLPADANARLLWWAIRLLRKNDVIPDEIRYRRAIDASRKSLAMSRDEATLRLRVREHNELVRRLNTLGTNRIESNVCPLDAEEEVRRWQAAR